MKNTDYIQAFAAVGIEIGAWPSPKDGWGWRFIHTAWNGPFATEAHAIQDILQVLMRHTTHRQSSEQRDLRREHATQLAPDAISPEEQADYHAALGRLFPTPPQEGWYWHVHDHYPVWIVQQHGRWYAHQVLPEHLGIDQQGQLAPGLYEQLVRIDKRLPDTTVDNE
jgi:hypothetical protein